MIINRVPPWRDSTGKDRWLLCDAAVASHLGADSRTIEQIVLHQEILCQFAFAGSPPPTIGYYRSRQGSFVDFVLEDERGVLAILLVNSDTPKPYELRSIRSLTSRHPEMRAWVVGPFSHYQKGKLEYAPWTMIL